MALKFLGFGVKIFFYMGLLSNYIYQILIKHDMEGNSPNKYEDEKAHMELNTQQISGLINELQQFNERIKKFKQGHSVGEHNGSHSDRTIYFDTMILSSKKYKQMTNKLTSLLSTLISLVQDNKTQSTSSALKDVIKIRSSIKSLTEISNSLKILQQTHKTEGDSKDEEQVRYKQQISENLNEITQFLSQFILKIGELFNIKFSVKDYLESIKQLLDGIRRITEDSSSPINKGTSTYQGASQNRTYQSTSPKSIYPQASNSLSQNKDYKYIKQKVPLMLKSTQNLLNSGTLTKDYVQLKDNLINVIKKLADLKTENAQYKQDDSKIVDRISQDMAQIQKIINSMIETMSQQQILSVIKGISENVHNILKPYYCSIQNFNYSSSVKNQHLRDLFLNNKLMIEEISFLESRVENQSIELQKINKEKQRLQEQFENQKQDVINTDNQVPQLYSKEQLQQEIQNAIEEYKRKEDAKTLPLIQNQQTKFQNPIQQLNKQLIQKNNEIQQSKENVQHQIPAEFNQSNKQTCFPSHDNQQTQKMKQGKLNDGLHTQIVNQNRDPTTMEKQQMDQGDKDDKREQLGEGAKLGGVDLKQQINISYKILQNTSMEVKQKREQLQMMEKKIRNYKIYDYLQRQNSQVMDLIVTTIKEFQSKAQQVPITQLIRRLSVKRDEQTTADQLEQKILIQSGKIEQKQNQSQNTQLNQSNAGEESYQIEDNSQSKYDKQQLKQLSPYSEDLFQKEQGLQSPLKKNQKQKRKLSRKPKQNPSKTEQILNKQTNWEKKYYQLEDTLNITITKLQQELNKSKSQLSSHKQKVINLITSLNITINPSLQHNTLDEQQVSQTSNIQDQTESHQRMIQKQQYQDQQLSLKIKQFIQNISLLKKSLSNKMSIESNVGERNQGSGEELQEINGDKKEPTILLESLIKITQDLFTSLSLSINDKLLLNQHLKQLYQKQQQQLEKIKMMQQKATQNCQNICHQISRLQGITIQKKSQISNFQKTEELLKISFAKTIDENMKSAIQFGQITEKKANLQGKFQQQRQISSKLKQEVVTLENRIKLLERKDCENINQVNKLKVEKQTLENKITELTTAKQGLISETNSFKLKNSQLEEEKHQNIIKITELTAAKQGLINETNSFKLKNSQLTQDNTRLLSNIDLQKGKNLQIIKQIEELRQSLQKITNQKTNFQLQIQELKLQIENRFKQQNELKENIKSLKNSFEMKEIDFDEKIQKMSVINKKNQQSIALINSQLNAQKITIKAQATQIDGLKKDNISKEHNIIALEKVQEEKIKLDKKVTQLTSNLNDLQKKFIQKERQTLSINTSSKLQQNGLKTQYEKLRSSLITSFEKQKRQFQQKVKSKMNETMRSFNLMNSKLNDEKIKYREESLKLSSFLVAIYQAMSKMNEFYQPREAKKIVNERKDILASIGKEQNLNQSQCQDVLVYSIKTIKMLENVIRQTQGNKNSLIASYETKVNQLIKKIDSLKNEEDLKNALQKLSQAEITAPISEKSTDFIDKVKMSFNDLMVKIADFIQEEQNSSTLIINSLDNEKKETQRELQRKISDIEAKYKQDFDSKIKTREREINTLKDQIADLSSKVNSQGELIKQLTGQLDNREREIKTIKSQNQKCSSEVNKKFEAEKVKLEEKIKQLNRLVEDSNSQLEKIKGKHSTLFSQSRNLQNDFNKSQSELASANKQIQDLKQQLIDKQQKLKDSQDDLTQKKRELQNQGILLNKAKASITSLQNQLSEKEMTIATYTNKMQKLDNEIQKLNQQYEQLQNQKNKSIKKLTDSLNSTSTQIENTTKQLSKSNSLISKVIDAFRQKIGKKVSLEQLPSLIISYQPPVGMKLIYSSIFHGQDTPRSQTIQLCEQFAGRRIKKTERLGRFPDTNSIVHQVPKQSNNFSFIMLYKTAKGAVFGSFSLKLKEQTFFFSFKPSFEQESEVRQWIPKDPEAKYPSVDFVQGKYIQYGSGELRINCIELKTISANSDIKGYYNFDWRTITRENDEAKIALSEVELHKVQFE